MSSREEQERLRRLSPCPGLCTISYHVLVMLCDRAQLVLSGTCPGGMRYRTASACTAVPHRMESPQSLVSFKSSITSFLGPLQP